MRKLVGLIVLLFGAQIAGAAVYTSTNVPLAIPDNNVTGVSSTITITDSYLITDLNITIRITHIFDGDLDIRLIAPGGAISIDLTSDNGSSGDNYTDTTFDDSAATNVTAGSAPFTGTFRPEQALSTFNGLNINGTWTLKVNDDSSGDTGTLLAWSLTTPQNTDAPEPGSLTAIGATLLALALRARRG